MSFNSYECEPSAAQLVQGASEELPFLGGWVAAGVAWYVGDLALKVLKYISNELKNLVGV